jgi:NTF2 fold immunity protein
MLSPDATLLGYMKEMNSWEKRCAARMEMCIAGKLDFDEATKIGTAEYLEVFRHYCSQSKAHPRDFHYTVPPDYDSDGEMIVDTKELSSHRVEICTQQNYSHKKRHIFFLALESDGWKLVERKVLLDSGSLLEASL